MTLNLSVNLSEKTKKLLISTQCQYSNDDCSSCVIARKKNNINDITPTLEHIICRTENQINR